MDSGLKIRTKGRQLEEEEEETIEEPVSPTGQYFNSSVLSVSIIAVLEAEVPIDHSRVAPLLRQVFLPINPRFSSIMVVDEKGEKLWKRVDVKLQDHIKMPIFPNGLSPKSYDAYFDDYLTKLSMEPLSQNKPLWELHIIMYPTSNATSTAVFKIHHALGDGYSLMAALLSCLKRADDPTLPITLPMLRKKPQQQRESINIISRLTRAMSLVYNSLFDFGWSILKSTLVEDDKTPIRSGDNNLELYPMQVSTLTFSLDQFKQIKDKLGVTINDIISGLTFLGSRLYMQEKGVNFGNSRTTLLVLLNTRNVSDYKSIEDMLTAGTESPWGNHFAFLHIPIPKSSKDDLANPLKFVFDAQKIIMSKRHSLAVYLTSQTLETMRKCIGTEATAKLVYGTMNNASLAITNMIGPVEKSSLCNHPLKGIYFMVAGVPMGILMIWIFGNSSARFGAPGFFAVVLAVGLSCSFVAVAVGCLEEVGAVCMLWFMGCGSTFDLVCCVLGDYVVEGVVVDDGFFCSLGLSPDVREYGGLIGTSVVVCCNLGKSSCCGRFFDLKVLLANLVLREFRCLGLGFQVFFVAAVAASYSLVLVRKFQLMMVLCLVGVFCRFGSLGTVGGLVITIVTYMRNVRIGVTVQKGFIDLEKFKSCLQRAFELISKAANEIS
ncbi:hypothetical protein Ancab_010960 [Ancistrocladus abbreviatus]